LIQNPKGGGLTSNFSSSSQLMGVQKTGDFLEKGTWILAISLMVLSLAINISTKGGSTAKQGGVSQETQEAADKAAKQTVPTTSQAPLNIPATGSTGSTGTTGAKK
jgi:preprotein translocase subunit SecG